ncbi:MAG: hypothetical protein J0G29_01685 [Alphaproteobacteria bacterium]|nr:hypothetical protein [Alphaproteobacteria bacterium]
MVFSDKLPSQKNVRVHMGDIAAEISVSETRKLHFLLTSIKRVQGYCYSKSSWRLDSEDLKEVLSKTQASRTLTKRRKDRILPQLLQALSA